MATILAEGKHLSKTFPVKGQGKGAALHAVSGVDLAVYEGETLALVGESGCGKSTLGRLLLGLLPPTQGQVFFDGQDLAALPPARLRALRRQMQLVFQDTAAALNPRWTVGQSLAEPLRIHNLCPRGEHAARGAALLTQVGLAPDLLDRYPHQLSGGQRQRVGLARALALSPRLVVCDEPVSALDVSVQAQMLNLLADLQASQGLTYVLISHDLGVVRHSADRVCVMFLGRVCEVGPTQALFSAPRHPYTKFLLDSVPRPDPTRRGRAAPPWPGRSPPRCTPLRGAGSAPGAPMPKTSAPKPSPPSPGRGTTRQPATSPWEGHKEDVPCPSSTCTVTPSPACWPASGRGTPPTCGGGNPSTSTWKSSAAAATCSRPSPSS